MSEMKCIFMHVEVRSANLAGSIIIIIISSSSSSSSSSGGGGGTGPSGRAV